MDEFDAEGKVQPSVATEFRLLMLTGCHKGEILTLSWEDVDLEARELRIRNAKTGPRSVALSPSAIMVLEGLPRLPGNPLVIVGTKPRAHVSNINNVWLSIRTLADLDDVRIHNLRHSFASRALGESLPTIRKLLGHRKVQTTARYAHLAHHNVKASAARVAESLRENLAGQTRVSQAALT